MTSAYPAAVADLPALVDDLWERRQELDPGDAEVGQVLLDAVGLLDRGEARVAELDAAGEVDAAARERLEGIIVSVISA